MTRDLTTGAPAKQILLFSIPLLVGNIFQQFYNMADTFIVGRTLGVNALAAVGSTGSIMFLILGFAGGLTSGLAIVTAQRFGAKDYAGVRKSFAASALISLLITLVLTVVSVAATRPFLLLLRTPAEILDDAYAYTIIIMAGIGATMLFNLVSNIMRAVGDSRSPLFFLVFACILNIILDYVCILNFNMGVAGAAVATVAAQVVAGVLCIFYIFKRLPVLRIEKTDWKPTAGWRAAKENLWNHLRIGLPMGFQSSIIAIGALVTQFALNNLGASAVAAYTTAQKIDSFSILILMSFGITMATYTAQNYGAGKIDRILQGARQCGMISAAVSAAMCLVNVVFGKTLAALFVEGETAIINQAHEYLVINSIFYFLLAFLFIFRYILQGLGHSFVPTLAGIMELIMRSFAAIVFGALWGYPGICAANPMAWLGALIPLTIAFLSTMRKLRARNLRVDDGNSVLDEKQLKPTHK